MATACIANQLVNNHNVDFYIRPLSGISRLLNLSVRQYFSHQDLIGKVVFVDIEQEICVIDQLLAEDKCVLLTCHAFPTLLHSVPLSKLEIILEQATCIHFVSNTQREAFIRYFHSINIKEKSFVIHNYTRQSAKRSTTGNIGIVGHLNREIKNALKGIQLAQQSNAKMIQCWGSETVAGLDNISTYPKLRINGWTDSIHKIHNSFDVLLSTSQSETFGLVIVEALSAGIPCVLSDIQVFRELFSECSGVVFLTGDDKKDIQSINELLRQTKALRHGIIEFWRSHFSNEAINKAWLEKLEQLYQNQ